MYAKATMFKLKQTWQYCLEHFGADQCVALALHGSQNYELDLPDSDIDAKLIIVPTWNDVINCKNPQSRTIEGLFGDINVVDIRLFIGNNLRKQNFNFLECLFTPYSCVNPEYGDLWGELLSFREEIAHYRPDLAVRTMMGQVENQYRRWHKFDDNKTLYHMARIHSAIKRYTEGLGFADTLIPENAEWIMDVRLGKVDQTSMEIFFHSLYEDAHKLAENAYSVESQERLADVVMDSLQARFVYRALYEKGIN